ncbi:MAG: hypothetical protein HY677_02510, partial [Chloroflexi bacterium]|nr:hypothetical protein [Chloroflexota bacterium]
ALLDEIEPDIVGFTVLAPFPGSDHYDPKLHADVDWSTVDEYANDLTRTMYLTNAELKEEQQRLVRKHQARLAFRNQQLEVAAARQRGTT